jgi:hypothetical protein
MQTICREFELVLGSREQRSDIIREFPELPKRCRLCFAEWPDLCAILNLRVPRSSSCEGRGFYGRQPLWNLKLALNYRLNGATSVACPAM